MPEVTYDAIQPLIAQANQEGSQMRCTFRCPVTQATVESSASIPRDDSLAGKAKDSVKRSLKWRLRHSLSRAVRSVLGHGIAGRLASDLVGDAVQEAAQKHGEPASEEQKKAAVIMAFEAVSTQFIWDGKNKRYVSAQAGKDLLTEFSAQLHNAPVKLKYDQGVLSRMLVEVARADGNLSEEEHVFMAGFIPPQIGTIEQLSGKPALSPAELAETFQGPVRETMLMLAWALACTDHDLDPAEQDRLREYARVMEIPESRAEELKRYAQRHLMDQALESALSGEQLDPHARQEAMDFAAAIGLDATEAERVEIRFRKRHGLI